MQRAWLGLLVAGVIAGCGDDASRDTFDREDGGTAGAPAPASGAGHPAESGAGAGPRANAGAGSGVDAGAEPRGDPDTDAGTSSRASQSSNAQGDCDDPPAPPISADALEVCPDCPGGARCLPRALVASSAPELVERLASCDDSRVCIPDPFIETGGYHQPDSCRSLNEAEGRCLSVCLPEVAQQQDLLPQGSCGDHERCVPCFDPRDGAVTGACDLTCDPGPSEPEPRLLPTCCGDDGLCVPDTLVPEDQRALLGRDVCAGDEALCAPAMLTQPDEQPSTCRSVADVEGRCLSTCMPAVREQRARLPRDVCAGGERCVPCYHPADGSDTGACRVHGDAPAEPPLRFDTPCCGRSGRCVPDEVVGAHASELPVERCAEDHGDGWVCAPDSVVEDPDRISDPFEDCDVRVTFFSVGSGKCVPRCIAEARTWLTDVLARSSCRSGEVCVPCAAADVPGC